MLPGLPNGTYDPQKVIFSFNDYIVTGWAEDAMIIVRRMTDTFEPIVGASGEESWTKSADRRGEFEIELMSTSQDNFVFSSFQVADELTSAGLAPAQLKDLNGNMICHCTAGRLKRPADVERKKAQGSTKWIIATTNLEIAQGGLIS